MPNVNSDQAPGQNKVYNIIVNGRPREVLEHKLIYWDAVTLAFPDATQNQDSVYTVAYANPHGKDGTLVEGQHVNIKDGVVFNVSQTNRS